MADELKSRTHGRVGDRWLQAFRDVPLHEFASTLYTRFGCDPGEPLDREDPEWLPLAYSLGPFVDAVDDEIEVSEHGHPLALAEALLALDPAPEHRVLVAGADAGYAAAVLSQYGDDRNVYAIDPDGADRTACTRSILDRMGCRPVVVAGEVGEGLAEHSPYDRILVTSPLQRFPAAWRNQLAPGGRVVADLKIGPLAGNMVVLDNVGDAWEGRFLRTYAAFGAAPTPMSTDAFELGYATTSPAVVSRSTTTLDPGQWRLRVSWFLACVALPMPGLRFGRIVDGPTNTTSRVYFTADDGSWAEVAYHPDRRGRRTVVQGGPSMLWDNIEYGSQLLRELNFPDWNRIGLTVRGNEHVIWVDDPGSGNRWRLRPVAMARSANSWGAPPDSWGGTPT